MGIHERKRDHLDICLNDDVERNHHFFDEYHFNHNALPEVDFNNIDTSCEFLGYTLNAPIIIGAMTGGTLKGMKINQMLAKEAQRQGVAFALGSERILLEDEGTLPSFAMKSLLPSVPLIGNLGAVNLNYGFTEDDINRAITLISADALFLHLNPLQEVIQNNGDTNFSGLLEKIGAVSKNAVKPIFVKEIGAGISADVAKKLLEVGVTVIDVSGKGGTTWSYIEARRNGNTQSETRESLFDTWGIPTPEALIACSKINELTLIAGGGVRTGLDIAKAIALGASLCSIGLPFLSLSKSEVAVSKFIEKCIAELKIAMFCVGAKNLKELSEISIQHNAKRIQNSR